MLSLSLRNCTKKTQSITTTQSWTILKGTKNEPKSLFVYQHNSPIQSILSFSTGFHESLGRNNYRTRRQPSIGRGFASEQRNGLIEFALHPVSNGWRGRYRRSAVSRTSAHPSAKFTVYWHGTVASNWFTDLSIEHILAVPSRGRLQIDSSEFATQKPDAGKMWSRWQRALVNVMHCVCLGARELFRISKRQCASARVERIEHIGSFN